MTWREADQPLALTLRGNYKMIHGQNTRKLVVIKQEVATNGATLTSDTIDTLDYDYLTLDLIATTSNNATNNPATLKLQEADVNAATSFADITTMVGDGVGGFTIPNSPTATTTAPFSEMNVNLNGRKRFLRLLVSPVTTQTFTALATLSRPREMPNSITERNLGVAVDG